MATIEPGTYTFLLGPHDGQGTRQIEVKLEITAGQICIEFRPPNTPEDDDKETDTAHVLIENWQDSLRLLSWRTADISVDAYRVEVLDTPIEESP